MNDSNISMNNNQNQDLNSSNTSVTHTIKHKELKGLTYQFSTIQSDINDIKNKIKSHNHIIDATKLNINSNLNEIKGIKE